MKIGFISAGTVAQTISKHALAHGHQVLLSNSRGPSTLASVVDQLDLARRQVHPSEQPIKT